MSGFFDVIRLLVGCGTLLALALMVLVALPQSKLRDVFIQIVGWVFAIFCGIYCISPVDIVPEALLGPFGLIDDAGALVVGIASAAAAWKAGSSKAA
jgi:uncharacterized membrane protein YkvA (DUF1232 family)